MFYNSGNYEAGYPWLSSKAYVKFFDYMEKAAFPIIIHLGGPEALWKKENVPEKIIQNNTKTHPHLEFKKDKTINIHYISIKAEKTRVALDFSIAPFTSTWR